MELRRSIASPMCVANSNENIEDSSSIMNSYRVSRRCCPYEIRQDTSTTTNTQLGRFLRRIVISLVSVVADSLSRAPWVPENDFPAACASLSVGQWYE